MQNMLSGVTYPSIHLWFAIVALDSWQIGSRRADRQSSFGVEVLCSSQYNVHFIGKEHRRCHTWMI